MTERMQRSCWPRRVAAFVPAAVLGGFVGVFALVGQAQSPRLVEDGVYTTAQAEGGQTRFNAQCAICHGRTLGGSAGPPLAGEAFVGRWSSLPLSDLVTKVRSTMPENAPGTMTMTEAAGLVAYILQVNETPAGDAELSDDPVALARIAWGAAPADQAASAGIGASTAPPVGNLAEVMRGIMFPSSNLLFNVQLHDPGAERTAFDATDNFSWVEWGAGIYSGWQIVDYAAIALAEAAPLFLTPGRLCENGQPVPVERPDWVRYTEEMVEAGRAAYRASQSRDQAAVSDVTNLIADACYNCHEAYRDRPGGTSDDPSNKAARCIP